MAARQDHTLLLDQLREQVHLVLENTGRLFAAASASPKVAPVAQSYRLKRTFPGAANRFHEALDKLEDELQLAKAVMRRDLAVWREKTGYQVPEALMTVEDDSAGQTSTVDIDLSDQVTLPSSNGVGPDPNGHMSSLPTTDAEDLEMGGTRDETSVTQEVPPPDTTSASDAKDAAMEPESTAIAAETTDAESTEPKDEAVSATALQLNTAQVSDQGSNQENSDDRPSDTPDLDSLFNDPPAASGTEASNEGNANNVESIGESNFEENGPNDFDLDSFSANLDINASDNDNIASLMQGLHDYANADPNSSTDFDISKLLGSMDGGMGQDGDQQEGEGQRDTIIDDLLNVAGDFDGGTAGEGDGNANVDFDFDSLFNQ